MLTKGIQISMIIWLSRCVSSDSEKESDDNGPRAVPLSDIYQPSNGFEPEMSVFDDSDCSLPSADEADLFKTENTSITLKRRITSNRNAIKKQKAVNKKASIPDLVAGQTSVSETSEDGIIDILKEDTTDTASIASTTDPLPNSKKLIQKPCNLSVLDPETGERKYICAVPTCQKQYKNANGLKVCLHFICLICSIIWLMPTLMV